MSECYGCGGNHNGGPCDYSGGDLSMVLLGIVIPFLFFASLIIWKIVEGITS